MKNGYEIRGDVTAIFIVSRTIKAEVLIDTSDFTIINEFKGTWCFSNERKDYVSISIYIPRVGGEKKNRSEKLLMHRVIMNPSAIELIDHINGNGLDNRRRNLRIATCLQNQQNRNRPPRHNKSGILGVHWDTRHSCWIAQINVNKEKTFLGNFDNINEAEKVVKQARARFLAYSRERREVAIDENIKIFNDGLTPNRSNKTSSTKNISWDKKTGKWKVAKQKDKQRYFFGYHDTLESAHKAAEEARKLHGS